MDLSIIILSFNTKDMTKQCLESVVSCLNESSLKSEIIIVDNNSHDESIEMLKGFKTKVNSKKIDIQLILNKDNKGYPKGNNQGIDIAEGNYILLLNSDVILKKIDFGSIISYLAQHADVGGLSIKLDLPTGRIDPASHRGFPTPWNAFCYFTKLEYIFGKIPMVGKIFGGYHLLYKKMNTIHEIDSPTGAFFMIPKVILKGIHGFDETFFMYGEDLDLAYRIKKNGYKIMYYPKYKALHMKSSSGLKGKDPAVRKATRKHFFEAMKIFYKKHYSKKYPFFITKPVYWFIDLKIKLLN